MTIDPTGNGRKKVKGPRVFVVHSTEVGGPPPLTQDEREELVRMLELSRQLDMDSTHSGSQCCLDDNGGSHYHCSRCGDVSSMMGHFVRLKDDSEWDRKIAARIGVSLPFEGFTCDTRP